MNTQPVVGQKLNTGNSIDYKKEKIKTYLYLVFSLLTISFFGIFAILPTFSTISTLNKEYQENKRVADLLETKLAALSQLDKEYEVIKADLPYIYNAIPSTSQIPTFTKQAETVAKESGVTLNNFSVGTVEYFPLQDPNSDLFSYTFTLEVTGTETEINTFIKNFISFNRLVSIERITSGKASADTFKASIGGNVFFSKDAQ